MNMTFFAVRRWVQWWFVVGAAIGTVVMAVIFGHNLKGQNAEVALAIGVVYWWLGGLICWDSQSVKAVPKPEEMPAVEKQAAKSGDPRIEPDERLHEFYTH